ncbi:hypothetical protein [Nostoc sp. ATCC 53789]|uniref:hypothetical protein n=1 Tax=Nostoc sp. ATCC 53789 TaxID=76335 RepID=UPI000DFD8069|nr:hypothetical protein [Nostoc sp. ATCC 53789]QHG20211.1 hypothetical protein GJB62_30105 [Nostoc sp. ATCC 53789]RCJ28689.1 hypothetical protein A6V25_16220 [Nostoc sp. ATCC 53789]
MKNAILKWISICILCTFLATSFPTFGQAKSTQNFLSDEAFKRETIKIFPNFPLVYFGSGRFQEVGNPQNQLVSTYEFDMKQGINRELAYYIDKEVLIYNVYDLDLSDGQNPDQEYFIQTDPNTGAKTCTLNPFPLPNVFSRGWWLANNMIYKGTTTINGFAADCWRGVIPKTEIAVWFCNRADKYPQFAPILKKIGSFEFYDHYGESREGFNYPSSYFKVPKPCNAKS